MEINLTMKNKASFGSICFPVVKQKPCFSKFMVCVYSGKLLNMQTKTTLEKKVYKRAFSFSVSVGSLTYAVI